MKRILKRLAQILLAFVGIVVCIKLFLHFVPLSLAPYAATIQKRLPQNLTLSFAKLKLTWKKWSHPFEIVATGLKVTYQDTENIHILSTGKLSVTPSLLGLLQGTFKPRKIHIKDIAYAKEIAASPTKPKPQDAQPLPINLASILDRLPQCKAILDNKNASLGFRSTLISQNKQLTLSLHGSSFDTMLFCSLQKNVFKLEGHTNISLTKLVPFALTHIFQGKHPISLHLTHQLKAAFDPTTQKLEGHWRLHGGSQDKQIACHAEAVFDTKRATLTTASLQSSPLKIEGEGGVDFHHACPLNLDLHLLPLTTNTLIKRWPQALASKARTWVSQNISKGTAEASLHLKGELLSPSNIKLTGTLGLNQISLCPLKGLPHIKNLTGKGTFDTTGISIDVLEGQLEKQKLQSGRVLVQGLDGDDENIDIQVTCKGPLSHILHILSYKPLKLTQKIPLSVKTLEGDVTTQLGITFPLEEELKKSDVSVRVNANLENTRYTYQAPKKNKNILHGLRLSKGTFTLKADQKALFLQGKARVLDHTVRLFLEEHFNDQKNSSISLSGKFRPCFWEHFRLQRLHDVTLSPLQVKLTYPFYDRAPLIFHLDLTNAHLKLANFWAKPKKTPAALDFHLNLHQDNPTIEKILYQMGTLKAQGQVHFNKDWDWTAMTYTVKAPREQDFQLNIKRIPKDTRVTLKGKKLFAPELLDALKGEETKSKSSLLAPNETLAVTANLDTLTIDKRFPLSHIDLLFRARQTKDELVTQQLSVKGKMPSLSKSRSRDDKKSSQKVKTTSPKALASFSFEQKEPSPNARNAWQLKSTNMGHLLGALGWLSNIKGGKLLLNLNETKKPNHFEGLVVAKDFSIQKTSFAQQFFITLTSPTSFIRLFSSGHMPVSELKTHFTLFNNHLTLERALAKSIDTAFTWKGWLDFSQNTLNIEGNVIPAYFLNRIITAIPIFGRILAGTKDDGLFATRFYIKGTLGDPKVSANPLTAITPGIFKDHLTTGKKPTTPAQTASDKTAQTQK